MSKIKLINGTTDFSQLKIYKYDWDVVVNGTSYQVAKIEGYVHSIGGGRGENDLWMWPRGEEPSYSNLVEYHLDGCGVCWGIVYAPHNYVKTKWNEREGFTSGGAMITRNGESFYFCRRGVIQALDMIRTIPEHPAELNAHNFEQNIEGRKIYYRSMPAVIEKYLGGDDARCVMIPEKSTKFEVPNEFKDECTIDDWAEGNSIVDTIFSPHIWWFRD